MLYQESQQWIAEAEARLREGDENGAHRAFHRAGVLQWELSRPADQVRTRSVFGLSAATLFYRAGDPARAEQLAITLLSQEWLED